MKRIVGVFALLTLEKAKLYPKPNPVKNPNREEKKKEKYPTLLSSN